jgi:type IV pilus assembly protein PilO
LASLPRIVTVHNVNISPVGKTTDKSSLLTMNAIIKTYNEELDSGKKAKKNRRK